MTNHLGFIGVLCISCTTAFASNPCGLLDPADDGVTNRTFGSVPYFNGQISYDSRRQVVSKRAAFIWSITENTSGYTIKAKWGTENDDEKYLPTVTVKNDNENPRCRIKSSGNDPDENSRILKYKRMSILYPWETEEPDTVFERSSIDPFLGNFLRRMKNILSPKAAAQNREDAMKLHTLFDDGQLPTPLANYYNPDNGLDVKSTLQDKDALAQYFKFGFDRLYSFSALVSDFPINVEALRKFIAGEEVEAVNLTPLYFYVIYGVHRNGDNLNSYYTVYSEILQEELTEQFSSDAFKEMNLSLQLESESDVNQYFTQALSERPRAFLISPTPGKGNAITIQASDAVSFHTGEVGRLSIRANDTMIPILNFSVLSQEQ